MTEISADDASRAPGCPQRAPKTVGMRLGPVAATVLALVHADPLAAAEATAWAKGAHSAARLIEGGPLPEGAPPGARRAGLEVRLDPAFITYWRDPGDAGVPPTFDFAGSTNLRSAEVRYPAPARLDEAGEVAFGYTGDVTFPIVVVAEDPAKPVGLRLDLSYAVCHDICLPARAKLAIDLDGRPSAEASRIDAAVAAVPRPASLGESIDGLAILSATTEAAGGVAVETRAPPGATLFVEAPEGSIFSVGPAEAAPGGRLVFALKRVEGPAVPAPPLTLTLAAPGDPPRAIEVRVQLDAAAKTP